MNSLEISLGQNSKSKEKAIKKFANRVLVVESSEFGNVRGKVVGFRDGYFELRRPANDFLAFFADTIYDIYYDKLSKASVENPVKFDVLRNLENNY